MSHIKTWDVEPPQDAAVPTRAVLSSRNRRLPSEDGVVTTALSSLNFTDEMDLVTAAQKLWTLRRQNLLTPDEMERALYQLETKAGLDIRGCESCQQRRAVKYQHETWVCRECALPSGDEVDRAWQAYKEATE